jgi:GNAT superfamily N-acetyltransferase
MPPPLAAPAIRQAAPGDASAIESLYRQLVSNPAVHVQGPHIAQVAAIEAFCAAQGCTKIMLLSARQREDAHRFFERCGFQGDSKRGFVKYRRQFDKSVRY